MMFHYDRRFERSPIFIIFLFNKIQYYSTIKKVSRLEKLNKSVLKNEKFAKKLIC